MSNLGALWYTLGLKDLTDADLQKINRKLENLGTTIKVSADNVKLPRGLKLELDPQLKAVTNEALAKAVEGKVMKVEVTPLLTQLRKALKDATSATPAEIEVGVQESKLRGIIQRVLNKQGFMLNISTVNDNYSKVVQQKLNGRTYTVRIHADANEISRSVQASLMQVQSRTFGLQVTKSVLYKSIDDALAAHTFPIQIKVRRDQARNAVQSALNNASVIGKDAALAYQRLQTGELRAAQAELARLKAAQQGAASAARTHASASLSLGGALGSNIKIAGELGSAMASLYSIHAAKQFLSQVIEIGGELEHQKIALETIYGSESKMQTLYGQIKGLARTSPFGVMDLTKNIKQLSAYGVAYNEVYDTAKRLADISAATSVDINRLILAFGKTKNRTFLDGLEAKQFAYANIPIYDALSKKLTELEGKFVSVKDVMGRIKKREIGFDMVKEILWDMTDEGGKFYNMQEKLAGSVKTSWKLVRDNIELMFGEIAESGVGDWLKGIGQTLQEVTRSWKALSTVIVAGGGAYAVYRMALMGTNALLERQVNGIVATYMAEKKKRAASLQSIGITSQLTASERQLIATRKRLTASDLEYLYVEKNLTTEEIKRLYLSRKISRAELEKAVALGVLTKAEFEQIAGTAALEGAWLRLGATTKGVLATMKAGMASAFGMVFNWTTAIFAAIAGVAYLIQHNMREDEIAKDFTKAWKQKGEDMSKELSELLSKPFKDLTAPEEMQLIEEYKEKIKDFSTIPEDIISRAIRDKDGVILDTVSQIRNLRAELQSLKETADSMTRDTGAIVSASGDGIFNEDVITNLKDWQQDYSDLDAACLKYVNDNKERAKALVEVAARADSAYRGEITNITNLNEKLLLLMANRGKYKDAWEAVEKESFFALRGGGLFSSLWKSLTFQSTPNKAAQWNTLSRNNVIEDLRDTIRGFKNLHEDWNWDKLTQSQSEAVRQFFKQLIEQAEVSSPELKFAIADIFRNAFNVDMSSVVSGTDGQKMMVEALNAQLEERVGSVIAQKVKNGLALTPEEQAQVTEAMYAVYYSLFKKGNKVQKQALNDAMTQSDGEGGIEFSAQKTMTIQARLNVRADWQDWQREIDDATGNLKPIQTWVKGSSDIPSFVKAVKDGYKEAKAHLDVLQKNIPLELKGKIGFDFADMKEIPLVSKDFSEASGLTKQWILEYNEFAKIVNAARKADEKYSIGLDDDKKKDKGSRGSQKDSVAENLKQRFKDIKDAWGEFQKWSKTEGRQAAAERIAESGLFSTLPKDKIPKTVEEYRALVKSLEDELRKEGVKGSARESLLNELLKQLLDIDKTMVDEQLKASLEEVSREAERQLADWNLFDRVRKATGDDRLAMNLAFGIGVKGETDYVAMMKKQFDTIAKLYKSTLTYDTATPELLETAPDEVRKAWEKAYGEIQKYRDKEREEVADMVTQYRNTQEEIIAITAEAEEKKRKIRQDKRLSDIEKRQLAEGIDADLNYRVFQKSGQYLKFFNAILSMTGREAESVGRKIKEALDRKLQAGRISAKEYCEEMEKIDKQLEKIREKQAGFGSWGSFLEGGLSKMFTDRYDKAQSDFNAATQNFDTAKQQFDLFSKEGNEAGMSQAQSAMDAASAMKEGAQGAMDGAQGAMQTVAVIDKIVHGINDMVQGIHEAFEQIKEMADSFGEDTSADTGWGEAGAALEAFSKASDGATKAWDSLKNGNIGGVISGVVQSIASWFTTFNRWHDSKLQKQIERSKEVVDNLQKAYDAIERRMGNFLGNGRDLDVFDIEESKKRLDELDRAIVGKQAKLAKMNGFSAKATAIGTAAGGAAGGVFGAALGSLVGGIVDIVNAKKKKNLEKEINALYEERRRLAARIQAYEEGGAYALQRQLMSEQLEELEKQRQAESDKKKSDASVISDYDEQIDELRVKIREFAIETAKDLYGIDVKDWASQLGDALFEAWKKGEDGAEAFRRKAGEILGEVVNNILKIGLLEPMMQDVSDYLFGTEEERKANGGKGGVFGTDFDLSPDEIDGLAAMLMKGMEGVDAYNSALDSLEKILNEKYGLSMKDTDSTGNMTKGLQSLTENTGDLLASYLNAVRADVAAGRMSWDNLLNNVLPQITIIADAQLTAQRQIAENTLRNAVAAEMIVQYSKSIDERLRKAQADRSTGFWMK